MTELEDRLRGGLLGLLVGDALGVPYEFKAPAELPGPEQLELCPPEGFARSHAGVPPGTWSDDGAQALCLLESLISTSTFDAEDFGQRLLRWYEAGHLAVDGLVFDVGVQTADALRRLRLGSSAGPRSLAPVGSNGNGSLMRVLPLALWHRGDDAALVRDAFASSAVTHPHARARLCCALYCLWVRGLLRGREDAWPAAVAALRSHLAGDPELTAELEFHVRPDDPPQGAGSGYVVDSLRSARWAFERGSYEAVVKAAIGLGRDTDTTAAIAGGAAGVRDGLGAIPQRFLAALRGRSLVEPLLDALVLHALRPLDSDGGRAP